MVVAVLIVAAAAYIALCGALFLFQRSLIYFPQPRGYQEGVTLTTLPSARERILVSTRPADGPDALLYFGGNAEDVSLNTPVFCGLFPKRALYFLHYRSYGGSSGRPTEADLIADALALFDLVQAQHRNVLVMGRSLGTGIAVHLASRRPVERLILITPFDSLLEVARHSFPYLPVRWILRDKFESWRCAPLVTAPTLIIAAERDEVIPRASTELLRSKFRPDLVSYAVIDGATHNTISECGEYLRLLAEQDLQK